MADLDRTFAEYESGLRRLHEDLAERLSARPEEREYLDLLHHLMLNLLSSYASYRLAHRAILDTHTSVMYAAVGARARGTLDVPLNILVDEGMLTPWQARFLGGSVSLKRTVFLAGAPGTGRSTLLNALVHLLPVDQRVVAVEDEAGLPALRDRAFVVRLPGMAGTPGRTTALEKAAGMGATWLLIEDLDAAHAPAFFEILRGPVSGLASLAAEEPEKTLRGWAASAPGLLERLEEVGPLVVNLSRDEGGRPRVTGLYEATSEEGEVRLNERSEPSKS
jgi:type IV secretory pathway ATPase VirB11/archaellum biosynthesis ATPase